MLINRKKINLIFKSLVFFLLSLGFYSSINIGFSWDEYFHHINGLVRFNFLTSFGENQNYQFRNNKFYPGLYDTISYAFAHLFLLIDKKIFVNYLAELMHLCNFTFAVLGVYGLYLITKKIFNRNIALLASLLTLSNPFFFGHMSMNSKDIIIFFSLIWFCNYFYSYCIDEKNNLKNLILSSIFIGFGCGVRLTFLIVIFPVVISGLIFLIKIFKNNYSTLLKRLFFHIIIACIIIIFFVIICWPHMMIEIKNGNFREFFLLIIKNTINWNDGPKVGLINGEFYPVFDTPRTYILNFFIYRMPLYSSILILVSYYLFLHKKLSNYDENFNIKFLILNFTALFPILLALILKVNMYDNIRLFLFVIPLLSLIAAFSLNYLIDQIYIKRLFKIINIFILFLFFISIYRFTSLTPYQYSYVNFTYPIYEKSLGKFEHDYWGLSYKELVLKIKKKYSKEEIKKFRIADCGGGDYTLLYYLNKYLGIKRTYSNKDDLVNATHIVMNDRTFWDIYENKEVQKFLNYDGSVNIKDLKEIFQVKDLNQRCFAYESFNGTDEVTVSRSNLPLTVFRKLNK